MEQCSSPNEITAWSLIKDVAQAELDLYPTTNDEDADILANDLKNKSLGFNARNCIAYRKTEKELLNYLVKISTKVHNLLQL